MPQSPTIHLWPFLRVQLPRTPHIRDTEPTRDWVACYKQARGQAIHSFIHPSIHLLLKAVQCTQATTQVPQPPPHRLLADSIELMKCVTNLAVVINAIFHGHVTCTLLSSQCLSLYLSIAVACGYARPEEEAYSRCKTLYN